MTSHLVSWSAMKMTAAAAIAQVRDFTVRYHDLVSGSIFPPAARSSRWMLKQVQHDGLGEGSRDDLGAAGAERAVALDFGQQAPAAPAFMMVGLGHGQAG